MSTKSTQTIADSVTSTGEVTAMVSPYMAEPDLQGDRIAPTAYDDNIRFWNSTDRKMPVLDSHQWSSVDADLGYVQSLESVPGYGLVAHIQLDMDSPKGRYAYSLLKQRRRVEWSIGYDVMDAEHLIDGSTLLKKLALKEVSLVLAGAAAVAGEPVGRTETLAVKGVADMSSEQRAATYEATIDSWREERKKVDPEIAAINAKLAEFNRPTTRPSEPDRVDEFVAQIRAENAEARRLKALGERNAADAKQRALILRDNPTALDERDAARTTTQMQAVTAREAERLADAAARDAADAAKDAATMWWGGQELTIRVDG